MKCGRPSPLQPPYEDQLSLSSPALSTQEYLPTTPAKPQMTDHYLTGLHRPPRNSTGAMVPRHGPPGCYCRLVSLTGGMQARRRHPIPRAAHRVPPTVVTTMFLWFHRCFRNPQLKSSGGSRLVWWSMVVDTVRSPLARLVRYYVLPVHVEYHATHVNTINTRTHTHTHTRHVRW